MWERVSPWLRRNAVQLLSLLVVLAAGGTIAIVVDSDGPDGPAPARTITIAVNTTPHDGVPTRTLEVPEPAVDRAAAGLDDHAGAIDERPSAASPGDLDAAQAQQDHIRQTRDPLPTAGASAGFRGCRTSFIGSYSSRNGVRPIAQVLHYTVSPNRPGWSDVDSITAYFARASTQASSHFVIDREGNCRYIVPIEHKAWTQGAGNPVAISYEIINTGSEAPFLESAGYAKLGSVVRQVAARTGIPLRRGAVSGGVVTRSGIVQHHDGGAAWGGHHDITPFSIDEVVRRVSAEPSPLTKVERHIAAGCKRPAGTGHSRRYWCRRSVQQRRKIIRVSRRDGDWRKHDRRERRVLLKRAARACR